MESADAPRQVRAAVALMWGSLVLTSVDALAFLMPPEDGLDWTVLLICAAMVGANAYLILCVARRENWARIVLLVLTILAVGAMAYSPPEPGSESWWSTLLFTVSICADVAAMVCLFSGSGHMWFKKVSA